MELPKIIMGYAEYDNDKFPFVYDNGILNLLPSTEVEWHKQQTNLLNSLMEFSKLGVTHEWTSNEYIRGITSEGKSIIFISKGEGDNNNGFLQYEIQVIYEYQEYSTDGDLINGLIISADEIGYFFNPSRVFTSEITFDEITGLQQVTVKAGKAMNRTVSCGSYSYGDISVSIEISAYSTFKSRSENPLSSQCQIYFEFDKAIDLDKALEIVHHQKSFLRYISYRKNVSIENIKIFKRNEKGLRETLGKIYIISEEDYETNKKKTEQTLTLELLEEKISPLFQSIADGKVYLEHLCNCIEDKKSYGIARIILIFAAFEREYNNAYSSQSIRSERYLKVKADILALLEDFEKNANGKSRKYVRGFKKIIDNSDNNLSERIKYAINSNIETLRVFLNHSYQSDDAELIENISQRMNLIRNNIAHGNLDIAIEPIHLADFNMLEIIIYVVRLSSLNISVTSIQKSICQLLGYNIYIQDKPAEENSPAVP